MKALGIGEAIQVFPRRRILCRGKQLLILSSTLSRELIVVAAQNILFYRRITSIHLCLTRGLISWFRMLRSLLNNLNSFLLCSSSRKPRRLYQMYVNPILAKMEAPAYRWLTEAATAHVCQDILRKTAKG